MGVIVGGTTRDLNITGLWFWRGNTLAFERSPDWQIDYEVYKWTKLDWDAPETKEMVYKYWKRDEAAKFGGKAFLKAKFTSKPKQIKNNIISVKPSAKHTYLQLLDSKVVR